MLRNISLIKSEPGFDLQKSRDPVNKITSWIYSLKLFEANLSLPNKDSEEQPIRL